MYVLPFRALYVQCCIIQRGIRKFVVGENEKSFSLVHERKKQFKCEICGYTHKGNVNKHVASVYGKKKSFKCEICQFPFSEKGNMNKHVALVHVGK